MQRARGWAEDKEEELTGAGQHRAMRGTLSVAINTGSRGALEGFQVSGRLDDRFAFCKMPTGCPVEDGLVGEAGILGSAVRRLLQWSSLRLGWEECLQGDRLSMGKGGRD